MEQRDPIAIIGLGCRFPGSANHPSALWARLLEGFDAIKEVPPERWDLRRYYDPDPDRPGKMYVREGGFLDEPIDRFDPLAFGISPREAQHMDPQQRFMLEVTWEALDNAGLAQEALRGRDVGVFVGGFTVDSMSMQFSYENQHLISSQSASGSSLTMLSNRISHVFDFRGPSVSMDTACSSSLMATHFACQSLWNEDCSLAIVGGVNVMSHPGFPIAMCKGGFLSPHARCMTFDERAAGYVRGEGAGAVVLKPLSAARRDGDRVYATIVGTGANQDGRTPGISLPNREAQISLIRRVLARSGVEPRRVHYMEAHGTGTQAGDAIEAGALDEVFGEGRGPDDRRLLVGSIKTNLGHLEAASGVAGLIKTALSLHHGVVPPNLHFERPNPKIPFDEMCLKVPTEPVSLPDDEPIIAGINSFGYGGANAHIVLKQAPATTADPSRDAGVPMTPETYPLFALPLSARDDGALLARAAELAATLERDRALSVPDLVTTAVHRSSHFDHRMVVLAHDRAELVEHLGAVGEGRRSPAVVKGTQPSSPPKIAFVYTGMGPQWWAMGRELMASEPVYAAAIREVDGPFRALAGWSIEEALAADEPRSEISKTRVAQPANFALQFALTKLWASWGIVPDGVVGHSVGEVASTWASGALDIDDAVAVSFHRSRLQQAMAIADVERGAMLAAGIPEPLARELAASRPGVSIAAINSATSITFSGDPESMIELAAHLEAEGHFNRLLDVEVAYHSHHMDPVKGKLAEFLASLRPRATEVPLYSTVTGGAIEGTRIDADYWCTNMREAVLFRAAIQSMLEDGYGAFIEVGPHPVLRSALTETISQSSTDALILPSLRRREPERRRMLETLGALYIAGHPPDWDVISPTTGRFVSLPRYRWQHSEHWVQSESSRRQLFGDPGAHPLLQSRASASAPTWRAELSPQFAAWLPDHRVDDAVVVPGAAYIEAAMAMARSLLDDRRAPDAPPAWPLILTHVDFHRLLDVDRTRVTELELRCDPEGRAWSVASSERGASSWTIHASGGLVRDETTTREPPVLPIDELRERGELTAVDVNRVYRELAGRGLEYGPTFRTLRSIEAGDGRALVELRLPPDEPVDDYLIHPALLDGAFQAVVSLLADHPGAAPLVPVGADRIELFETAGGHAWAHIELTVRTSREVVADVWLLNPRGRALAVLRAVTFRPLPVRDRDDESLHDYGFGWVEQPLEPAPVSPRTVLLVGSDVAIERAQGPLVARQATLIGARLGDSFECHAPDVFTARADALDTLLEPLRGRSIDEIVVIVPETHGDQPMAALESLSWGLMRLARALAENDAAPRLTVVSSSGGSPPTELVGGALTAMLRVVQSEYAALTTRAIELEPDPRAWDRLADELLEPTAESELRLRKEGRDVRRLEAIAARADAPVEVSSKTVRTDQAGVCLELGQPGILGSLRYVPMERRAPEAGEVELRVEATGISFKDLLKYTGQVDPRVTRQTYCAEHCGSEFVGVVVRVGSAVTDLRPGDRVWGMPDQSALASFVTLDRAVTSRIPDGISSHVAAAMQVSFMTAWHSLHTVARLREGETVLIHSAAGGVGLTAVQIAKGLGARVIATVGTEDKRRFLHAQGVEHVSHSRSLAFVDDVRRWTQGRGVDVVLSALSGEGLVESIGLLARHGRFVDIGKRAMIENERLPLRMFNEGLSYCAVDMDRMVFDDPRACAEMIQSGLERIANGTLTPPPVRSYPAREVIDAFRTMAQGEHIGRLVVDLDHQEVEVVIPAEPAADALIRDDGTYVVTGGLGGFGLEVGRWLAEQGAGALILMGRRGLDTPGARDAVDELRARGVRVFAPAVDVTNREDLNRALGHARAELPPVRGVFHCAMVLDDGFIDGLSREQLQRVLAPKVGGAWNLHQATADDPLDLFVGFSSVAVAIGNPGQASYVAANGFLDALARHRRAQGRPGTSIHWGVLGEVGVVTRNREVGKTLADGGMTPLTTREALEGLERALRSERAQLGVFTVDWERWSEMNPEVAARPLYAKVHTGAGRQSPAIRLLRAFVGVERNEWPAAVAQQLREHVAELVRLEPDQIGLERSLSELGIDSLLGVELINSLAPHGYPFKIVEIMRGPTINELARTAVDLMQGALDGSEQELRQLAEELPPEQAERLEAMLREEP